MARMAGEAAAKGAMAQGTSYRFNTALRVEAVNFALRLEECNPRARTAEDLVKAAEKIFKFLEPQGD